MGRPPQKIVGCIWSSTGSICQLRDTKSWLASGLAISTVPSMKAVWSFDWKKGQ